jgi:chemotaxis protein histidine kinase CheA
MGKNDDGFNLDDMMEIFGDAGLAPAPAKPVATATQAPPPKATVTAEAQAELDQDELAILAAYEKSKREQKERENEARRKKEEDQRRILEDFERQRHETEAREAKDRAEREAKRQRELEDLKKKEEFQLNAAKMAEEEARIIEEFEKQAATEKIRQEEEKRAKEASAQADLQRLAEQQRQEAEKREAEVAVKDAELQAQAAAVSKKDSRLMELLAKTQQDLQQTAPPPLPGMSALPPVAMPSNASDVLLDIEVKENEAFCYMLDETRKAMFTFLAPLIGIKAATNMLNKTVEKARTKAPIALKDANWKMDGSLRDDGSVDPERMLKNVAGLPAATRVADYLTGMRELCSLRVKAVEAGLGATTAAEMKTRVIQSRPHAVEKKIKADWIDLFYNEVVA